MTNQYKKADFKIEIEIWQGLMIASVLFIIASTTLLFGAVLPQDKISHILEYNSVKTKVYADYTSTQGFGLDNSIYHDAGAITCDNPVFFESTNNKNASYSKHVQENSTYIQEQMTEEGDFAQFLSASLLYNEKLNDFLDAQDKSSAELTAIFNDFQDYCSITNREVMIHSSRVKEYFDTLAVKNISIKGDWVANHEAFNILVSQSPQDARFSDTLKNSPKLQERYTNLFVVHIDFKEGMQELEAVDELFLEALRSYELAEFTEISSANNPPSEILYFSDAVQVEEGA